jgi:polyisoprenyl-teichoic acid--peptidoglycan teichoic acid transferase
VSPLPRPKGSPRLLLVGLVTVLAVLVAVIVVRSGGESSGAGGAVASSTASATGRPPTTSRATPSPTAGASTAPVIRLYAAHGEASLIPALEGKRPLFILSLGSDARPGQDIRGQRSDSIHIIGIDLSTNRATILGFPRDSWVNIPGHGPNKINAAMHDGGPDLTVRTLEDLTGIPIDFWMLTSFPGLVNMVNHIGGIDVNVPYPMHDSFSHANFSPGMHHMRGKQALAFARDRHDVPGGDLGRSKDQGILLLAALAKFHTAFAKDPTTAFTWIQAAWPQIRTDLSVPTMLQLALAASQIPPSNVNNMVVPAAGGTVGGYSVVFIQPSARALYADMRADGVVGHPG